MIYYHSQPNSLKKYLILVKPRIVSILFEEKEQKVGKTIKNN